MDELRESSLLFSLEGLMETERERVKREAREAQKRRDEEQQRVAEAAERHRAAAEKQREARERREALERERQRLEHERLEALKQATVERARIEAESGLRLIEAEQQRKHELSLARMRETERTAHYRRLTWLSCGALCVALSSALGAYFGWLAPAHSRAQQHLQSVIHEGAERRKATELLLAVEQAKNRALNARVEQLAARAPAPSIAEPTASSAPKLPTPVNPPASPPLLRTGGCRDTGDPLDNCLR